MARLAWPIVGLVMLLGAYVGWEAAANRDSRVYAASVESATVSLQKNSTLAVVAVPVAQSLELEGALEAVRQQTRNRRLEALYKILHRREIANLQRAKR